MAILANRKQCNENGRGTFWEVVLIRLQTRNIQSRAAPSKSLPWSQFPKTSLGNGKWKLATLEVLKMVVHVPFLFHCILCLCHSLCAERQSKRQLWTCVCWQFACHSALLRECITVPWNWLYALMLRRWVLLAEPDPLLVSSFFLSLAAQHKRALAPSLTARRDGNSFLVARRGLAFLSGSL